MKWSTAMVVITGGSEGIGKALAQRFLGLGSQVLVTGRSAAKLAAVAEELRGIHTFRNDISQQAEREALAAHIRMNFAQANVLINNAGIQRRVPLADEIAPWAEREAEIHTLLSGPVHLNHLLVPALLAHTHGSCIVNVTSGGAYIPQAFAPIYSACKAALHSYTVNLRYALSETTCRVVEMAPPAVQTTLGGAAAHGTPLDVFCDDVFQKLVETTDEEIGYGPSETLLRASQAAFGEFFKASSARANVKKFSQPGDNGSGGRL